MSLATPAPEPECAIPFRVTARMKIPSYIAARMI